VQKSPSSKVQIFELFQETKAGARAKKLCRRNGIRDATFYDWKAIWAGREVREGQLKKFVSPQALDFGALKIALSLPVALAPAVYFAGSATGTH
jgi:putative transposase